MIKVHPEAFEDFYWRASFIFWAEIDQNWFTWSNWELKKGLRHMIYRILELNMKALMNQKLF